MIKFDSQYHLYDVTPLENLFIQQYMVKTPGDYVKVYIYCLNLCYYPYGESELTYDSIASALKLNTEDVQRALRYWMRLGVMSVECFEEKLDIQLHSAKEMLMRCDLADNLNLYKYADFNNALSEAFAPRILDTQDYLLYQDMINIFEVSEEYVVEAVKYAVKMAKSTDIPYKYVEKIIEAWKNDNINTVEALKTYLEKRDSTYKELCTILRYLGMNRAPTIPELNCYKKWTDEYKFTFDAIKEACNATISANSPTIKYLDSILTSLHEKKISSPEEITKTKAKSENYRTKVRKLMYYMGMQGAPSVASVQLYTKWENDYHYTEEDITIAASLVQNSRNPFEALDSLLESYFMRGIKNGEQMLMFVNKKKTHDEDIKALKSVIHDSPEITDTDRDFMHRWLDELEMPIEVVLSAAALALTANKPWLYINKIMLTWHSEGIKTLEQAQERMASVPADTGSQPAKKGKSYSFTNIDSHTYSQQEYENMFDNFSDYNKK